ncbi:hypothetical protein EVU91_10965 [Macrococcoides bohemicum]|uniref:hypothetical protein n=1 Tax=Macrococcoides bohemicum TaxID=1903056 RepID=UPI001059695F|nr:hypothetical protein [Macrococcus bohemicus]TDL35576.1 hypothetical protein EVU91_10965 [Macrococcus bohemicus]
MNHFIRTVRKENLEIWEIRDTNDFKNQTVAIIWEDDKHINTLIITTHKEDYLYNENNSLLSEIDSLTSALVNTKAQKFYFEFVTIEEPEGNMKEYDNIEFNILEFDYIYTEILKKYKINFEDFRDKNFK